MFSSNIALWTSKNYIAFIKFNDTQVDSIQFNLYGEPGNPQFQYPILEQITYPKVSFDLWPDLSTLQKFNKIK